MSKKPFIISAIAYIALIAWLIIAKASEGQTQLTVCPSKLLYHFPCPGCGLTRATMLALRGDIIGAIKMNPNVIPCILFLVGYPVLAICNIISRRPLILRAYNALLRLLKNKAILIALLSAELAIWLSNALRGI